MEILLVSFIVFAAAFVQGVACFGSGLVLMPSLVLLFDITVVAPMVALLSVAMNVGNLASVWRSFDFRLVYRLLIGALIGVPLGVVFLKSVDPTIMKRVLGAVIVAYAFYGLARPTIEAYLGERSGYPFGFVAGLVGGAFNVSGPPMAVYSLVRRLEKSHAKMIMSTFLLINGVFIVASHAAVGLTTASVLKMVGLNLPILCLGVYAGSRLFGRIDQSTFIRLVNVVLVLLGLMMFV